MTNGRNVVNTKLIQERDFYFGDRIESTTHAIELMAMQMPQFDREMLCVINLKEQGNPISVNFITVRGLSTLSYNKKEVFRIALAAKAESILLLQNHASGDPTPSREDIEATKEIAICAKIVGMNIWDHIIIARGTGKFYSFYEEGILPEVNMSSILRQINIPKNEQGDKVIKGQSKGTLRGRR